MRALPILVALTLGFAALSSPGATAAPASPDHPACASGTAMVPDGRLPAPGPRVVCAAPPGDGCARPAPSGNLFRADGRPLTDWRAACVHRTDRTRAPVTGPGVA